MHTNIEEYFHRPQVNSSTLTKLIQQDEGGQNM